MSTTISRARMRGFMSDVEKVFIMPLRALGLSSHIDVPMLYNILNTIGVFVLLVLIYLLVYAMSESALLAAAAAIFAIGGYHWLEYGTVIKMLLTGQQIFSPTYNIFGRSTQPYTALVPFVGFLICTYRALMQELPRPSLQNACSFCSAYTGICIAMIRTISLFSRLFSPDGWRLSSSLLPAGS